MNTTPLPMDRPRDAGEWLARLLSPDCSATDHAAFEDWLAASPDNAVAYVEVEQLHAVAGGLQRDDERIEAASRAMPISPSPAAIRPTPRRRPRRGPAFAVAASVIAALGLAAWIVPWGEPVETMAYATAVGEQRTVSLPEGSTLVLDTDTRVHVSYDRALRRIHLQQGRLQAAVATDPDRPFEVVSGRGTTRALGTIFQVEQSRGATVVRLIEGRVLVDTRAGGTGGAIEIRPSQLVAYDADGELSTPQGLDQAAAAAWLHGKLVFKDRALGDLLAEFNRYSVDKIAIGDPALAEIRISGVFDARDQAALIESLRQGWNIHARRTSEHETSLHAGPR